MDELVSSFRGRYQKELADISIEGKKWKLNMSESQTSQGDTLFHWVPPMEQFFGKAKNTNIQSCSDHLAITSTIRNTLKPGMVVVGFITSKNNAGIIIQLTDILYTSTVNNYLSILSENQAPETRKPLRYSSKEIPNERRASFCGNAQFSTPNDLQELKELFLQANAEKNCLRELQGFCHSNELDGILENDLTINQKIVAVVTSIPRYERIALSLREKYISSRFIVELGPIAEASEAIPLRSRSFLQIVRESSEFNNPNFLESAGKHYNLDMNGSMQSNSSQCLPFYALRNSQSLQYINEAVRRGVELAKQEKYDDAIKCYNEALNMDSKNVNAMVAKGAALANLREYERAIKQLEQALQIDPTHINAKKYLQMIEDKLDSEKQAPKTKPKKDTVDDVYNLLKEKKRKTKHKNKEKKKSHKKRHKHSSKREKNSSDRGRTEHREKRGRTEDKTLSPPSARSRQNERPVNPDEPPPKRNKIS